MEVRLFALKNYSSPLRSLLLEANFSNAEESLSEEEEDILEFTEIFQMLKIPLPNFLKEKFDFIVREKRIPGRKSSSSSEFKTFFVYTENKIISQICDMLNVNDVCRIYEAVKKDQESQYELNISNVSLDENSMKNIPGLKDVAFYYFILQMIDRKALNRLHTHTLEHFLKMVMKTYEKVNDEGIERFKRAIKMLGRYPVSSNPPGICLIFCMQMDRKGSDDDLKKVKNLFEKKYCYDVTVKIDPSSRDIKTIATRLQFPRNKFYDSLVVWFMGHGELNHVLLTDGMIDIRKEFIEPFSDIDWLNKKPKLFFIQACLTEPKSSTVRAQGSNTALSGEIDAVGIKVGPAWKSIYADYVDTSCINNYADLLISYATKWYEAASRQKGGSLYVNTAVDQLKKYGHIESIENVLRKIHYYTNSVLLETDCKHWKQTPYYESSLQKEFVFPNLDE